MSSVIPAAVGFKFGQDEGTAPNTVRAIAPAEALFVNYVDGEGREQTRLVFRVPGAKTKTAFIVQEKIGGQNVVTPAHDWFAKKLEKKVAEVFGEDQSAESV
jgi:hypothetical protein